MHLTYNENIKILEYAMCPLELEEDLFMASKTSANVHMVGSISQNRNGARENLMVGTNTRVKMMFKQGRHKSSANLEKEKEMTSLRKRSMCPSSNAIIVA